MDRVLASYERGDVKEALTRCDFEHQTCDYDRVMRFLRTLAGAANRASLMKEAEREVRRAWWNVMYWTLPSYPACEDHGWD
jgi:hypothetical protein